MNLPATLKAGASNRRYERQMILIGANDIGIHLAATLGKRGQNIILIDEREDLLAGLNEEVDVLTLAGHPLARQTLAVAGIEKGVRLMAVTDSDELNILLLFLGESLGIIEGYALVRSRETYESFLPRISRTKGQLHLIHLWELVAGEVERKAHLQMRHLYTPEGGDAVLAAVHILPHHPMVGESVQQLKFGNRSRVLHTFYRGRFQPLEAGMKVEDGMVLLLELDKSEQERGMRHWVNYESQHKVLIGGTECLQTLQLHWPGFSRNLVCIENDLAACRRFLQMSPRALVLRGDGLDIALLKEEARLEEARLFLAASEYDEMNLLSSLVARSYQVKQVLTLLHRRQHSGMLERISLDGIIAIPQLIADHFLTLLWPGRGDSPLTQLEVQLTSEPPREGFSVLYRNGVFLPVRENQKGGEMIAIVKA